MKTSYVFLLAALAALAWLIWAAITLVKCKKSKVDFSDRLRRLWDEPFWIGPHKLAGLRDKLMPWFAGAALLTVLYERVDQVSYMSVHLPVYVSNHLICIFGILFYLNFCARLSMKQRLAAGVIEVILLAGILPHSPLFYPVKAGALPLLIVFLSTEVGSRIAAKIQFGLLTGSFLLLFVLSAVGVIPNGNISDEATRGSNSGLMDMRYSFGWVHPNTAGFILVLAAVLFLVFRADKSKWYDLLIAAGALAVVWVVMDSRGSALFLALFVILFSFFRLLPRFSVTLPIKILTASSPALAAGVSVASAFLYNSESSFWRFANKLSTGRVGTIYLTAQTYPLTLFGQKTDVDKVKYWDNTYISVLYKDGALALAAAVILISLLIWRLWKKKAFAEVSLVVTFSVYFIVEGAIFEPVFNIMTLLFGSILLMKKWNYQDVFTPAVAEEDASKGEFFDE